MPAPYRYWIGPWQWTGGDEPGYQAPVGSIALIDLRSIPRQSVDDHGDGVGNGFFATPATSDLGSDYALLGEGYISEIHGDGVARSAWQSLFGINPQGTTLTDYLAYTLTDGSDPTGDTGPKPLVGETPTTEATLHLSGHSVIWKGTPNVKNGTSRWERRLNRLLRAELQRIADTDPDPDLWRKVLGAQKQKYRQAWDDPDEDDWLPQRLKNRGNGRNGTCKANKPATTFTESWPTNGTDFASGQDIGWTEVQNIAYLDVSSNRLNRVSTVAQFGYIRTTNAVSSADHYASTRVVDGINSSQYAATVTCRNDASVETFYRLDTFNSFFRIVKRITGTNTTLATPAQTIAVNDIIRCTSNGSTQSSYLNGVQISSVTDTSITSNMYPGTGLYMSAAGTMQTDDWRGGDLSDSRKRSILLLGVGTK